MFSVKRIFRVQFLIDSLWKIDFFYQIKNTTNVGMKYFGSRGFCGFNGVSAFMFKLMIKEVYKKAFSGVYTSWILINLVPSLY